MRSCRASHKDLSFKRATAERYATNGTKLRLSAPSRRSVESRRYEPTPISTVSKTNLTRPVLTNIRTPSRSSIPRVINSPVCTLSWKEKLKFCNLL